MMVDTNEKLLASLADPGVSDLVIAGPLQGLAGFRLRPGQTLVGNSEKARLGFLPGSNGVQMSSDNRIANLAIACDDDRCTIWNDVGVDGLGALHLENLQVKGCVRIVADDKVRDGHVFAGGVNIVSADARDQEGRPQGYGVEVLPGAFTLWNRQKDPAVTITADLTRLRAGSEGRPVKGSGIFVAGAGFNGGRLAAQQLDTGAIYSDGGIAEGTPDCISGGVFVVSGAVVNQVHNESPVTTYGPNDMVLDNWGTVDNWTVDGNVTSYGPSAIGFVNFGLLNDLLVNAPIETFGRGARGFNVYDGTLRCAEFDRIVTHGDGAVGIQISQRVGDIVVRRGLETFGGIGDSLVKGVVTRLAAIALSVRPGGWAKNICIRGGLRTHGAAIPPLEMLGHIERLDIDNGFAMSTAAA
jgi:hypothetical protein